MKPKLHSHQASKPQDVPAGLSRRKFLGQSLALTTGCVVGLRTAGAAEKEDSKPIGTAKGIHPGRVVWSHDPEVLNWKGPEDGHWWESNRLKQDRVDSMMARAVCELTGESKVSAAWPKLFGSLNQVRGRQSKAYQPGEKILIKPNWVGLIYHEGHVDLQKHTFIRRHDYMNTAPQMILALLRQLVSVGVSPADITICDTLACEVNEFHDIFTAEFPQVRHEDYSGGFGKSKVKPSKEPLFWSCRPKEKSPDFLPTCFAEADYLINFANLKAHTGGGVTLCAKNHYGSLVRWPVQQGYYDMHPGCFSAKTGEYRPLVDLMGHEHLGGKTVLYLLDGLFSGVHPRDPLPQHMQLAPFNGQWPCSLFVSQDPVAIDSVGYDFLWAEWKDFARKGGVDDYLHEAALANDPPSGTFYDPNHPEATHRLSSLGVHEHWNNPQEKKYSRNLATGEGIELIQVKIG